ATPESIRDAGRSRTCFDVGLQPTAWPSGPGVTQKGGRRRNVAAVFLHPSSLILHPFQGAGGGTRTHLGRFTRAVLGLSSIAGLEEASAGVEPARPRFRASVPCRGPGQQ